MEQIVPNQGGPLEAYYAQAGQLAQQLGIDPAYGQALATETVATKVASACMWDEYHRIHAAREEAAMAPTIGEQKLAAYAPMEHGPAIGVYRAIVHRQQLAQGGV